MGPYQYKIQGNLNEIRIDESCGQTIRSKLGHLVIMDDFDRFMHN